MNGQRGKIELRAALQQRNRISTGILLQNNAAKYNKICNQNQCNI